MQDRTCILVTHATDLMLPLANFIVEMTDGTISFAGGPSLYSNRLNVRDPGPQNKSSPATSASRRSSESLGVNKDAAMGKQSFSNPAKQGLADETSALSTTEMETGTSADKYISLLSEFSRQAR